MIINGANHYANQFPAMQQSHGFKLAANYGGGFMQAANQRSPQADSLWCLPIQNFRVDGGTTDLYSKKISIDWPEFRPQSPIFSGPRVKQDTTNLMGAPSPNYNFDDCGYTNFSGGFIGGGFPGVGNFFGGGMPGMGGGFPNMGGGFVGGGAKGDGMPNMGGGFVGGGAKGGGVAHMGGGIPNMGGFPNMGGGIPNMGGGVPNMGGGVPNMGGFPNMGGVPNMGGFPNMPMFPDMGGFPLPGHGIDSKDGYDFDIKDPKPGKLAGKGTIDGVNFRSGDGERYELKVESGKSYNLLSDVGIGLNGTYGTVGGETVLTDIALNVGGKIITLADDGTLRVDGQPFDKKKNNLGGLVTENKNGSYTVKANGYEFELKAAPHGIKVGINATNARTPEGLWGVALDGEKNTESELQKAIKESDYKIDNALSFDYEDNNNIGAKYTPTLDDEERNELAWNSRNPVKQPGAFAMFLNFDTDGARRDFGIWGDKGWREDDAYWSMDKLQPNKFYNVFSDEDIQVNGKFASGKPTELGFMVNGDSVRVERTGAGIKLTVNDSVVTSYNSNGITFQNGNLVIKSDNEEGWQFQVGAEGSQFLSMRIDVDQAGLNNVRSTGLLGDAIAENIRDNGNDLNGAGYLRNEDGSLSKAGQDMTRALRSYMVDSWDDTSSGRSVYE